MRGLNKCECGCTPHLESCDNDTRFMYRKVGNVQYAMFCECGNVGFQSDTIEGAYLGWNDRAKIKEEIANSTQHTNGASGYAKRLQRFASL